MWWSDWCRLQVDSAYGRLHNVRASQVLLMARVRAQLISGVFARGLVGAGPGGIDLLCAGFSEAISDAGFFDSGPTGKEPSLCILLIMSPPRASTK